MRVENLEHLLNEEATDINEMLKVTVAIILLPSYLDHHHHCHHHQQYIISSHHHNYLHHHQVNISGDQQHTDRERGHRHQKHEKALHVIILHPKKRNFKRNMTKEPHVVELCLKRGTSKKKRDKAVHVTRLCLKRKLTKRSTHVMELSPKNIE